ncbi:LamG-like jellyroll fold domain-containing protein [Streptomyces collinus]
MPPMKEGERSGEGGVGMPPPQDAGRTTKSADDLTLARAAAGSGSGARAAVMELTRRHLDAIFAYAAQCTMSSRTAALLASTANQAALRDLSTEDRDPAWRPYVLAAVLRTAADWARDDRRERLDPALLAWLGESRTALGDEERQPPLAAAFQRLSPRIQVCLWHLTVEGDGPGTLARLLGTEPKTVLSSVPALEDRLRNSYMEVLEDHAASPCRPFTRLLMGAAESRPRAVAAWTVGGLDAHVAGCADCARALRDLTRLHDADCGALLAEELLQWGGPRYFSDGAASGGHRRRVSERDRAAVRGRGRSPRPRGKRPRAAFIVLGACATVVLAVFLWRGDAPRFEWTGQHAAPSPSAQAGAGGPMSSVTPSSPPSTWTGAHVDNSLPTGPSSSVSAAAAVPGLAVPGAVLRWDFRTSQPAAMGVHPGIFVGGARPGADRQGSAHFDGTGYLVTQDAVLDTDRSFTVSAWVRLSSKSGFQTVAGQDGDHVGGFFLQYSADADRWRFAMGDTDSVETEEAEVRSQDPPGTGRWQHLTGAYDAGAHTILLYVNGVLQGRDEHEGTWSADGRFTIGRGWWGSDAADLFHGDIDDVRAYGRALAPSQVEALAKARPNG